MLLEYRPKLNGKDGIFTRQQYNSRVHADSQVEISTSDRGQLSPDPKRDLRIEFERVSENGRMVGGAITFYDGEDVKLLLDFLNSKFDKDGHLKK